VRKKAISPTFEINKREQIQGLSMHVVEDQQIPSASP
jgi:hypothetical protein